MKLVIFAGGIGTRLWPLSRENSPKQFDKFFSGKSTLQLAVERVAPAFGPENIFIQTVSQYREVVSAQVPDLASDHIIIEPERRNLGPAVCLSVLDMKRRGFTGAMSILWADHLMDHPDIFIKALHTGAGLINRDPDRFVFLGEHPRFANNNLGWIKTGAKIGTAEGLDYFAFKGWKYKPTPEECEVLFRSGESFWNPGYFITSIAFLEEQYRVLAPDIYNAVKNGRYSTAEATHFDRAIIEKVDLSRAIVIKTNMGWSDPGTLYALKEALQKSEEANVVNGETSFLETTDSLLYNLEEGKIIAGVGLKGMVVVNTPDALVVVPKDKVVMITDLVKKMKAEGKTKFL
jgi:mannose-1-phosphate guanylyltransferase